MDWSNSVYRRCVLLANTFEAGVFAHHESIHTFQDCLIVRNAPFEQIWQRGNSKINFQNCIVIGTPGKALVSLGNGSVAFQNCTLLDAQCVAAPSEHGGERITLNRCLVGRMEDGALVLSEGALARVSLDINAYVDLVGHRVGGTVFDAANWADLQSKRLEDDSFWPEVSFSGELNAVTSTPLKAGSAGERARTVGAELPGQVWNLYAWLKTHCPTPGCLVSVEK